MEYWHWILLQILPLLAFVYFYQKKKYSFWSERGIRGPTPVPFLGNFWEQSRRGQLVTELEWAKKYGKIYGTYNGLQPVLAINDPELIKQVMIKDFNLFVNRRKTQSTIPIASRHLFALEGDDWKRVRTITSPTFTSGKLRGMNALMDRCVAKLGEYFEKISTAGTGVIDTKVVISGFTIDVIASTSFATETNANGDRSERNPFVEHGTGLFRFTLFRTAMQLLAPLFARKLINKLFPPKDFNFFIDLSKEVVRQRRSAATNGAHNGGGHRKRNDFVQLLMDAGVADSEIRNSNYEKLTADADKDADGSVKQEPGNTAGNRILDDDEIVAQCFLFFIAGFETTASTISHCVFELARSPDVQNRLVQELAANIPADCDPNSDAYYDTIMNHIPYLDAVIKETLRKYPPVIRLERRSGVAGYKLGGVTLDKDQLVTFGAYAVQHNPEYYPEPERFDPDRFMPENKHLLTPYTYLPFGQGPRNCVGMRFAYQEIKLCLARLLPRYRFAPTPDTPDVLKFSKIGLMSVQPFPLAVTKRA